MSDPVARLNASLEGRYAIEREIGEGGMATVYLADDLKHERKVAEHFRRGPGKYAVESDGRLWVLRRFGRYGTLASGASVVSVREQAFARLRGFAPCSFRVIGKIPEEWRLESDDGQWEQAEPGAVNP